MPLTRARQLIGRHRSERADRLLGFGLSFVAGAVNVGGLLKLGQYTSHMTGVVSAAAEHLAKGMWAPFTVALASFLAFLAGSASSAIMINFARRAKLFGVYALPVAVEAVLMLAVALLGHRLEAGWGIVPPAIPLFCFIMGLQNAVITKLSRATIRTTHVTGLVTDLGIEFGKLIYWNRGEGSGAPKVLADRDRIFVLSMLLTCFFTGGLAGAWGFARWSYLAALPLSLVLLALAAVPLADDVKLALRKRRQG